MKRRDLLKSFTLLPFIGTLPEVPKTFPKIDSTELLNSTILVYDKDGVCYSAPAVSQIKYLGIEGGRDVFILSAETVIINGSHELVGAQFVYNHRPLNSVQPFERSLNVENNDELSISYKLEVQR